MFTIAKKAMDQVEAEYPDIDIREEEKLIDKRFTKLAHEYEDMMLPGLIKETEEGRKIRNEHFASRRRHYDDDLMKIRCSKTLKSSTQDSRDVSL